MVIDRIAPRSIRHEPLRRAGGLMLGILSGLERKSCWTIAEYRGEVTPDGAQRRGRRGAWRWCPLGKDRDVYPVHISRFPAPG